MRSIPALAIAALAVKVLVLVLQWTVLSAGIPPAVDYLDRGLNLLFLVLAVVWAYRLRKVAQDGLLWRVSRKLVLSYILIGAVPILLLVTFALLAFLLLFFDVSSYLVRNRLTALSEQSTTFARTTLFEMERLPSESHLEVLLRRQAALDSRFPGVSVALIPLEEAPRCGTRRSGGSRSAAAFEPLAAGEWQVVPRPDLLPRWIGCEGFGGIVIHDNNPESAADLRMVARGVAVPQTQAPGFAVVVDLPIDASLGGSSLAGTGITLGNRRAPSFFNTALFVPHTDWQTGNSGTTAVAMSVDLRRLYGFLGGAGEGAGAAASFNQILLYFLIGIGVLLLVIEVVALGNGLALARSITGSVDELFRGTERIKEGDFTHRITVRSDDQLGQLTSSFNDMTGRVELLLREQDEKRRLEEELRVARSIQMSLLPQGQVRIPGCSVAALCAPAREVGGDYYDVLPLPDGRIGLLIADVAGKGTSAALYMAELKGLMLSLSRIHTSPRSLLIEANRIIANHLDSRSFITMIYAVVDPDRRTLTCARAGHTPFVRIPAGDGYERRARVLAPDGMVLGLNLDGGERFERVLKEVTIPLLRDDVWFFFTDGISEAMDANGDCFGETRLVGFLERHVQFPPATIRDRLLDEVVAFSGGQAQHDDITMIILKVDE